MKILVTGAFGQLGSEIKLLSEKFSEWNFLFTDVDTLNISETNAVINYFQIEKPDYVINCAAYTAVDKAETDIENAGRINAIAPGILANIVKQYSAKMIHISTDYVFNGKAFRPLVESDEVNPTGVYGQSKLAGEKNCLKENPDSVIIRTSWLYSTYGNNFVKTMLRLGKEKGALKVVFDQVGSPTYAADLAGAILDILKLTEKKPEKFVPGIYHYSNEGAISWFDFSKAIFEIAGLNCSVSPVLSDEFPAPAKRPHYSVLNKSKIINTFGLEIPYWKDSLKVCIEKLKNLG